MDTELIHLGFGNILAINKVVAIVSPNSEPIRRLIQEGKNDGLVIDMTKGRRTKAVLMIDSGHIVLAAITPETIASRLSASRAGSVVKGHSEGETE
jgi:regulator of extracellular matrix RemA (YlzA/DUF370 family)